MLTAAVGLRMRDVPIIANLTMAVLLIFCGVNVPLDKLPDWMHAVAEGAADDARDRSGAAGRRRRVARERAPGPVLAELALGSIYLAPASRCSAGSSTKAAGTAHSIAHEIAPSHPQRVRRST